MNSLSNMNSLSFYAASNYLKQFFLFSFYLASK